MSKRELMWSIFEFVLVTVIGVILAREAVSNWFAAIPASLFVGAKIARYYLSRAERLRAIKATLRLLLILLPYEKRDIRCTLHVPARRVGGSVHKLRQVFGYFPADGPSGEKWPVEKGIIGRAYREKRMQVENFASDDEYRGLMVQRYGYTEQEMAKRTRDRRSYLCHPIVDPNTNDVVALLYFDSREMGTFTDSEDDPICKAVTAAAEVVQDNL